MTGKINAMMAKDLFRKGESRLGKNGAFHVMLEEFPNKALDAEMDGHFSEKQGRRLQGPPQRENAGPSDESLVKPVHLAYRNIKKKWTMPLANWPLIAQQLCIGFEDRFKIL